MGWIEAGDINENVILNNETDIENLIPDLDEETEDFLYEQYGFTPEDTL
jgi:hypothetical protein